MKILSREQIQEADRYTIDNEPIPSIDLMDRASKAFCDEFLNDFYPPDTNTVFVFAGKGNNGGDGLAISRLLLIVGFEVRTFILEPEPKSGSPDFETNLQRLQDIPGASIEKLTPESELPNLPKDSVIIDAIFGTGLSRPIEGFIGQVVSHIRDNSDHSTVVAVDIPSGLFCDEHNPDDTKVPADLTYTFQVPKYAFFIPDSGAFAGRFKVLDIGLCPDFLKSAYTNIHYLTEDEVPLIRPRQIFSHKGDYGRILIAGGSYGKIGAPALSIKATLKTGGGLVTGFIPECGYTAIQSSIPEAMVMTSGDETHLTDKEIDPSQFDALAIGPGLDTHSRAWGALEALLEKSSEPLVLDADALNILAAKPELFEKVPAQSILTPHPGEFSRIAGKADNGFEQIERASELAHKHQLNLLLKGAYSVLITPKDQRFFNSTGNPGMASGGSGDVLTGILASLLARGLAPDQAGLLGMYIHGISGDYAAYEKGEEGMTATDIIEALPKAMMQVKKKP